ncbi:sugar transferase [Nitrospira sp. BLG_1]|uniref:sugar transferase n=1 Tax=Nitrospira sp. BLG_1 TaxID=3395883 RepID=UPI0039BC35B2
MKHRTTEIEPIKDDWIVMRDDSNGTEPYPMLLEEQFFKQAIMRERKRADRSGLAMVMVLVELPQCSMERKVSGNTAVMNALSVLTSDVGILGWFTPPYVIGLIMPDIDPADVGGACDRIKSTVKSAVTPQSNDGLARRISIKLLVYPEPTVSSGAQVPSPDLALYPELSTDHVSISKFQVLKRGMDIVLSSMLLLLFLPVFAFIAVFVKLSSPGPVFFKQIRVGHLMKPFTMYKFRSMHATADHSVHHDYVSWFISASGQAQAEENPTVFKLTNDTRITPIGRLLRRTSLDELPQFWNVLIGDMSLVGPRPPLPYELQQYKPWHRSRVLEAKPGITGLWQVVGRSRTTFDEMVRLDLRYARTMSLWSDIKILLTTPAAMITGKGAC